MPPAQSPKCLKQILVPLDYRCRRTIVPNQMPERQDSPRGQRRSAAPAQAPRRPPTPEGGTLQSDNRPATKK